MACNRLVLRVLLSLAVLLTMQPGTAADTLPTAANPSRTLLQGLAPKSEEAKQLEKNLLEVHNPEMKLEQCGKPGSKCGAWLSRHKIACPKGLGYCDPGFYCGLPAYNISIPIDQQSFEARCLPVPASCGMAGFPCCPSNAVNPHTKPSDLLDRKPFCTDGSTCLFANPQGGDKLPEGSWAAGNTGLQPCLAIPKDCGTVGKACCPNLSGFASYPAFDKPICAGPNGVFCNWDSTRSSNAAPAYNRPGSCEVNPPDCGQLNKACCTEGSASDWRLYCDDESKAKGLKLRCVDDGERRKEGSPRYKCRVA